MEGTRKRLALYARVSTMDQHPEAQLAELWAYTARREADAVEFVDEGVSGSRDRRPALDVMMAAVRRREVDAVVVTKLDDGQSDFRALMDSLRDLWGTAVVPFNVPLGQGDNLRGVASALDLPEKAEDAAVNLATANEQLIEAIVETDEAVMERYLEGEVPNRTELADLLPKAVAAGNLIPVFCTSAKKNVGLTELLDGLALCGVAPNGVVWQ